MQLEEIQANIALVEARIARACARAHRKRHEVQLIAVSKTFAVEVIEMGIAAGLRVFGENRVQEAAEKFASIRGRWQRDLSEEAAHPESADPRSESRAPGLKLHLIGHLQSNKAKRAVEIFDMIQTVDRPEIAGKLDHCCEELGRLAPILIQVHLGNEETKSGLEPQSVLEAAKEIAQFRHLRVRGLMAIPPFREEAEASRADFRALRELAGKIQEARLPNVSMHELSMGMSHDFEVAIEEGATMIRVGTALFGKREKRAWTR